MYQNFNIVPKATAPSTHKFPKNAIKMRLVWNSTRVYGVGGEHNSNFKQFPHSMYHIMKQLDDIVAL